MKIRPTAEELKQIVEQFPYLNMYLHTDIYPYKISSVRGKTIKVVRVKVSENKTKMKFVAGGFSAHCENNYEQRYDYEVDEKGDVSFKFRIITLVQMIERKRANDDRPKAPGHNKVIAGYYFEKNGTRYRFDQKPIRFHDYNF